MSAIIELAERGFMPDAAIRAGIRKLLSTREKAEAGNAVPLAQYMERLAREPVAVDTSAANEQHYEVPAEFFVRTLGPRLKYSCCLYPESATTLAQAEELMLALTCERAGLAGGQEILELGCGWGSLSLWMAEHYPASRILAVSNSNGQREFIQTRAAALGLKNLEVVTCDMNHFDPAGRTFNRVVSVEMFEHMRNYRELMRRVSTWLRPGGRLFVHIFTHRSFHYLFETEGDDNWMGRYFFTGGQMPSRELLPAFHEHLECEQQWTVNGKNYSRTLEDWLVLADRNRREILAVFEPVYGREAKRWFQRWRMFYLACSELFAWDDGNAWDVTHYLFKGRT